MNKKIVCFDVDGTLTDTKSSWGQLVRGLEDIPWERFSEIYWRTDDGSMSFAEGEKILKELFFASRNTNRDRITHLFEEMPLREGAPELIDYLRSRDYLIYLVSGTVDMYVEMVAKQLKPDGFFAHSSFKFDDSGRLCDIDYTSVGNQRHMKANYIRQLSKQHGVPVNEIIFAGDSENDLEAFKLTGKGIAVEPFTEILRAAAWKIVGKLAEIRGIL